MFSKAGEFVAEVKAEVKKVTWPTRREAMSGTAVVVFVVLIMAMFWELLMRFFLRSFRGS